MGEQREFTLRAVIAGVVLSLVMAAANLYLGLKGGMTISANIPCSVVAIILFGTIMRSRSIAEVNMTQATGSTGEGLAAGLGFVFPALVLAGVFPGYAKWGAREYLTVTLAVLSGSVLGVVLTGFLREPMVVRGKELRFPEGVATAEILKTGMAAVAEGKREGIWGVTVAFAAGFLVKALSSGVSVFQETVQAAFRAGNSAFKLGCDMSAALFGVGFIIEFNGAALVAMGGALAWLVFIPFYTAIRPAAGDAADVAFAAWKEQIRFIGVGGMIVGGLWSIFNIRDKLVAGIKAAVAGLSGPAAGGEGQAAEPDLSQKTIWALIILGCVVSAGVYFVNMGVVGAGIATVYTVLAVFFFVAISVYIVGLIGSTNQPVSGITICTFLLAALFLFAGRISGPEAVKSVLLISGVVCLSACLSGTAAQNFKTASLVGGTPRAIQTGLLIAVVASTVISAPLMVFLDKAFKIGSEKLPAPQAGMFASLAKGLFIEGAPMPWNMVAIGVGLAVVLIIIGLILKRIGSSFGISPMAVSVGIYLPFTTTLPILLGGLVHLALTLREKDEKRLAAAMQTGTVLCAGLVAGEAITAVVLAVPTGLGVPLPHVLVPWEGVRWFLSILVLLAMPILLYLGIRRSGAGR